IGGKLRVCEGNLVCFPIRQVSLFQGVWPAWKGCGRAVPHITRIVRSGSQRFLVLVSGSFGTRGVRSTIPTRRANQCLDCHLCALGEYLLSGRVIPIAADAHAHVVDCLLLNKGQRVVDPAAGLLAPESIIWITYPQVAHACRW